MKRLSRTVVDYITGLTKRYGNVFLGQDIRNYIKTLVKDNKFFVAVERTVQCLIK